MRRSPLLSIALVLGACVFFTNLASPQGLHQNDEDHYLGVARNMLDSGDFVVPSWDGHPTFMKPPLLYWMMAASMQVLGPTVLAARLPVAVLSLLTALAVFAFGRRLLGSDGKGALAAMLTVSTLGFLQYGRVAMMDLPLAALLLCATWATWRIGQGSPAACYAFFAAVAGSVMLKGPASALVPLLGAGLWLAWGRRHDPAAAPLPWMHVAGGCGLFVALVGVWPLALQARGMFGAFYEQFIIGENLGKFAGGRNPVLKMVGGFLALLMPWTLLVLGALVAWARSGSRRAAPAALLPLLFVAANLFVYSLPAIKWAQYLLPSLPLLVLVLVSTLPDGDITAFGPIPTGMPVKFAAAVTGTVFLVVTPLLTVGSRLFPEWETRVAIFVLALALATTALCLLAGTRLFGAAASFAVVLTAVTVVAPALSLERLPTDAVALSAGRELMTYGVPPYGYQLMLGRSVGVCSEPPDFRANFNRGVVFIVGQTEARALMDAGVLDITHAESLAGWRKWRRGMKPGLIIRTIFAGKLDDLTENVMMMRYAEPPPPSPRR